MVIKGNLYDLLRLGIGGTAGPQEWHRSLPLLSSSVLLCDFQSILLKWTKGFKASGCEGEDVVTLLKEAIHRREVGEACHEPQNDPCSESGEVLGAVVWVRGRISVVLQW